MNTLLLIYSINLMLQFQKRNNFEFNSPSMKKKVQSVIYQLDLKSKELQQPVILLIKMYAYFYVHVFKARSSNMILLKVSDFFEKSKLSEYPIFSNDDIEQANNVEQQWNLMHQLSSVQLPFQVRRFMGKSKIRILSNTYFQHSNEFHYFCMIAKFINEQRLNFPQIHSNKEFFLHLPIISKRSGNYHVYQYLHCQQTMDKYYQLVYGNDKVSERLPQFLTTLTNDSLEYLTHSSIWCKAEALAYLHEKRL